MADIKKWSYEELDAFINDCNRAMQEARAGGSYVKAFEHTLHKDFRGYGWMNSDMNPFVVRGYDETMRVTFGAEMSGHGGWKYPILEQWADPEQGIIAYEWLMESPWPAVEDEHYSGFYAADGTGYTVHWYAGDMQSLEQEDLGIGQPLQWSHELGLATGQMSKTLEDQFYLRRMKEKQAMLAWRDHLEDIREEYGNVLNAFLAKPVDALKYFWIEDNAIGEVPVKIARSGYTGELGYEIYVHPDHAKLVEEKLEACGKAYGIMQIKTDVSITSLPREKGFVLMSDLAGTNPLEDGFGWTLDLNKEFIGKAATMKIKEEGAKRALLGFTVEDDAAEVAVGADVVVNGVVAGKVTMFTYGYTVEKNIGFALVELDKANVGSAAKIGDVDAVITERMFYDPENKRIRG